MDLRCQESLSSSSVQRPDHGVDLATASTDTPSKPGMTTGAGLRRQLPFSFLLVRETEERRLEENATQGTKIHGSQ